jgi:hypothetical protein
MFALACIKPRIAIVAGLRGCLSTSSRRFDSSPIHSTSSLYFYFCALILKIKPNDLIRQNTTTYNHQNPSVATCFGPFPDHPQANISIV